MLCYLGAIFSLADQRETRCDGVETHTPDPQPKHHGTGRPVSAPSRPSAWQATVTRLIPRQAAMPCQPEETQATGPARAMCSTTRPPGSRGSGNITTGLLLIPPSPPPWRRWGCAPDSAYGGGAPTPSAGAVLSLRAPSVTASRTRRRKAPIYALVDVDVTTARTILASPDRPSSVGLYHCQRGPDCSCPPGGHACRHWRGQLVMHQHVDITAMMEIQPRKAVPAGACPARCGRPGCARSDRRAAPCQAR
jgi:hypothetical protein